MGRWKGHSNWRCWIWAVALVGVASPSSAHTIVRYASFGSAPPTILESVRIPAGAETLMLSGVTASLPASPDRAITSDVRPEELGDTKAQTINVLNHIEAVLARRGYAMSDIVRLTVYLVGDAAHGGRMDYAGMNEGYLRFFGTVKNPGLATRATVQVSSLAQPAMLVEIEATAARIAKPSLGRQRSK